MPKVKGSTASEVATIESQASVVDAARRMIREKKGPLPVVEGDVRSDEGLPGRRAGATPLGAIHPTTGKDAF